MERESRTQEVLGPPVIVRSARSQSGRDRVLRVRTDRERSRRDDVRSGKCAAERTSWPACAWIDPNSPTAASASHPPCGASSRGTANLAHLQRTRVRRRKPPGAARQGCGRAGSRSCGISAGRSWSRGQCWTCAGALARELQSPGTVTDRPAVSFDSPRGNQVPSWCTETPCQSSQVTLRRLERLNVAEVQNAAASRYQHW